MRCKVSHGGGLLNKLENWEIFCCYIQGMLPNSPCSTINIAALKAVLLEAFGCLRPTILNTNVVPRFLQVTTEELMRMRGDWICFQIKFNSTIKDMISTVHVCMILKMWRPILSPTQRSSGKLTLVNKLWKGFVTLLNIRDFCFYPQCNSSSRTVQVAAPSVVVLSPLLILKIWWWRHIIRKKLEDASTGSLSDECWRIDENLAVALSSCDQQHHHKNQIIY